MEVVIGGGDISLFSDKDSLRRIQTLQRKALFDSSSGITKLGITIYHAILEGKEYMREKIKDSLFEEWWKVYPQTDSFEVSGKKFDGLQKKAVEKNDCLHLFNAYVHSNEFTGEEIISATRYHFDMAKRLSITKKTNQLTYIPNSKRYLAEKRFSPYIERSKEVPEEKKIINPDDLWQKK